jgi:hypothetical protein
MRTEAPYPIRVQTAPLQALGLDKMKRPIPVGSLVGVFQTITHNIGKGSLTPEIVSAFSRAKDVYSPTDVSWGMIEDEHRDRASVAAIQVMTDAAGNAAVLSTAWEMTDRRLTLGMEIGSLLVVHLHNARVILSPNWVNDVNMAVLEDRERAIEQDDGDFLSHAFRVLTPKTGVQKDELYDSIRNFLRRLDSELPRQFRIIHERGDLCS